MPALSSLYIRGSGNITRGVSICHIHALPKQKKGAPVKTPSVRFERAKAKDNLTVLMEGRDTWTGELTTLGCYRNNAASIKAAEVEVDVGVTEAYKRGQSLTFLLPVVVSKDTIVNACLPYGSCLPALLRSCNTVRMTVLGVLNGKPVDLGRYLYQDTKREGTAPPDVHPIFNLAGELDFASCLHPTDFENFKRHRNSITAFAEKEKNLNTAIQEMANLSLVIVTYSAWGQVPTGFGIPGRYETLYTFVMPIFRDTDQYWLKNMRTKFDPYDLASFSGVDVKDNILAEHLYLAQYVHAGGVFYDKSSELNAPLHAAKTMAPSVPAGVSATRQAGVTTRGAQTQEDARPSVLSLYQRDYAELMCVPKNRVRKGTYEPRGVADFVIYSTSAIAPKILFKYLHIKDTLSISLISLPAAVYSSPGPVLAALAFTLHNPKTVCCNHISYNALDLVAGARARFMAFHMRVDRNFMANADDIPEPREMEFVVETQSGDVVCSLDKFSNEFVDEVRDAPDLHEADGGDDAPATLGPGTALPTAYSQGSPQPYGDCDSNRSRDELLASVEANLAAIERENQRLRGEVASLQKMAGMDPDYADASLADKSYFELQPASLTQMTIGNSATKNGLLNDIERDIQELISISRRRNNEIAALSTQVDNPDNPDAALQEYRRINQDLEEKVDRLERAQRALQTELDGERQENEELQRRLKDLPAADSSGSKPADEAAVQKLRIQYENQILQLKKENLDNTKKLRDEIERVRATQATKMKEAKRRFEEDRDREIRRLKTRMEEDFMAKLNEIKDRVRNAMSAAQHGA
ncbi:hypothetical protein GMRT_15312 [Giardia muris]|uniref:Uncharacterized protein n=1 Tax=Giardia muris TaxID=5742 RepID=A0A4Z1SSH1_GIAMU|nr:hypothetical protein GMRT_15312 [Giardia muris]|eukprot:TNJ28892.1 hypothetical protein GMRT_15312 [Giardia muris]